MAAQRPALGSRIVATAQIVKTGEPISDIPLKYGYFQPHRTRWVPTERHIEGVFIGYRTLAEGETHMYGDEDVDGAIVFYPERRFEAWLVVTDPRRKPIYVLPADVVNPCD